MKSLKVSAVVLMLMSLAVASAISQVDTSAAAQAPKPAGEAPAQPDSQAKEIAIYGEIQSVNAAANTLTIQYYDYDSDSEKTSEIVAGNDTKIENARAIGDIKKGDWADVTYIVTAGRNMARLITVEKEEPEEAAAGSTMTDVPSGQ